MTETTASFAIRIVFESGRDRIVRVFSKRSDALRALYDLDMCGIAKAEVVTLAG
jgi:hypothetical protein